MKTDQKMRENEYDFTLVLTGITPETPGVEDALFNANCDDATLSFRMNRPFLSFTRNAVSLKEAILSAIHDIRSAGISADVLRIDYCNLVTQADIARKIDKTRQSIQQYMTGKRGPGGFPGPACELSDGVWLWFWCEVADWLYQNGMIDHDVVREADDVETINCILEIQNQTKSKPDLTHEIVKSLGSPCG